MSNVRVAVTSNLHLPELLIFQETWTLIINEGIAEWSQGLTCANCPPGVIWIMKVEEICKYCEYLHFTTQMTWTRALLLQGLQAAGGPHITKDPVSISNPNIKLLI